jgi:hypothetical protein
LHQPATTLSSHDRSRSCRRELGLPYGERRPDASAR